MGRKKKRKKSTPPKRWNFNRKQRLAVGKNWIQKYDGQHIVRGYTKRYKVDVLCAITELKMLGVEISKEYEQAVKQTVEGNLKAKRLRKEQKAEETYLAKYIDEGFAFVIGYTSGGVPYGLTYEEMGDIEEDDEDWFPGDDIKAA